MNNVAVALKDAPVSLHEALVTRIEGAGRYEVQTAAGAVLCGRAVSCLVEPMVGDTVLVARGDARAFVTAVLVREAGVETTLAHQGDLKVEVKQGRFTVVADEGVELVTGSTLALLAAKVSLQSPEAQVWVERLAHVGQELHAEVARVRERFGVLDQTIERWSQRAKRVYRTVEELERLKAEQIDYEAAHTVRVHGENTVMTADALVRVDGEQIHLG